MKHDSVISRKIDVWQLWWVWVHRMLYQYENIL